MTHEDDVRRLLADARHDEPMPSEVVARLDAVLADLVADREGSPLQADPVESSAVESAPVVDLSARRRRRRAAVVLAAAAVVVAGVGIGIGQILPDRSDTDSSPDTVVAESATPDSRDLDAGSEVREPLSDKSLTSGAPAPAAPPPALHSDSVRADLLAMAVLPRNYAYAPDAAASCAVGDVGRGDAREVTYDGAAALAVFRAPRAGARRVDIYLCEGVASPLVRSVDLPLR